MHNLRSDYGFFLYLQDYIFILKCLILFIIILLFEEIKFTKFKIKY